MTQWAASPKTAKGSAERDQLEQRALLDAVAQPLGLRRVDLRHGDHPEAVGAALGEGQRVGQAVGEGDIAHADGAGEGADDEGVHEAAQARHPLGHREGEPVAHHLAHGLARPVPGRSQARHGEAADEQPALPGEEAGHEGPGPGAEQGQGDGGAIQRDVPADLQDAHPPVAELALDAGLGGGPQHVDRDAEEKDAQRQQDADRAEPGRAGEGEPDRDRRGQERGAQQEGEGLVEVAAFERPGRPDQVDLRAHLGEGRHEQDVGGGPGVDPVGSAARWPAR